MPIRESQRARYPNDWRAISKRIRERAGQRCECTGQCGDEHDHWTCGAVNGSLIVRDADRPASYVEYGKCDSESARKRAVRVVLTVAHLNHDPSDNVRSNLLALCQRCHLRLDRHEHAKNARETRRARKATGDLFERVDATEKSP